MYHSCFFQSYSFMLPAGEPSEPSKSPRPSIAVADPYRRRRSSIFAFRNTRSEPTWIFGFLNARFSLYLISVFLLIFSVVFRIPPTGFLDQGLIFEIFIIFVNESTVVCAILGNVKRSASYMLFTLAVSPISLLIFAIRLYLHMDHKRDSMSIDFHVQAGLCVIAKPLFIYLVYVCRKAFKKDN